MKLKHLITCLAAVLFSASAAIAQTTIAKWTFETSQPGVLTLPATPGAGVWITNIAAEVGAGTASAYHKGNATYSTPAGNGSAHSISSATWTNVGDCYQFAVSTVGYQAIGVSWNQVISATAPTNFSLSYSTDGVNFTPYYSYLVASSPSWSSGSTSTSTSQVFAQDLSAITALNGVSTVYFRVALASLTNAGGTNAPSTGTSRVDNFTVTGTIPGTPAITLQPQNVSAYKGDSANFSVTAGGTAPLAYQWYYTNSVGTNKLVDGSSGYGVGAITNSATNTSVTLTYVDPAQAGGYFVVVTNSIGSITSSVANLTVSIRTPIPTTIYAIRTNQTAAWFPADTTNLYTVTGTVFTPFNMTAATSREFYIEDTTGEGISVFVGGGTFLPNQGDSVTVTGPIGQFDGLLEFNMSAGNPTHSVTVNSSGNPLPTPKYFDFASLTNIAFVETNVEGSLVVVSNVFLQEPNVAGFVSAADVVMTNANVVKLNLFVNAGANDVIASTVPPFASSVIGVFGQYTTASPATNSYELDILQYAGLVSGTPVTANPDFCCMASNTTCLFSVLANDKVLSPLFEGALTVSAVSTTNGVAAVDGTGTNITFTPDTDFVGTLTIGYTATDTAGYSSAGVVMVTVTNVPAAAPATIVPTVPPSITGLTFANGNIVITGTNAQATGVYYLLSNTNAAAPFSQWTPVATNVVGTANGFTFIGTNVVTPGCASQFYILSSTNNQ